MEVMWAAVRAVEARVAAMVAVVMVAVERAEA